jgi:mono/diheme cytochrome c family protein
MVVALLASAVILVFDRSAFAQAIGAGELIAKTQCASCHTTDSNGPMAGSGAVPSFSSIANTGGTTTTSLEVFLSTPHARMPNYSLSRSEISNICAYIMSLRSE